MPARKTDVDHADEAPAKSGMFPAMPFEAPAPVRHANRIDGARFIGGAWLAADGTPLTAPEAQQAHRAMDRKAADARAAAILGRSTE